MLLDGGDDPNILRDVSEKFPGISYFSPFSASFPVVIRGERHLYLIVLTR